MAQEPNKKDVTRTVEQGGLATTRRAQFGLDHGHGQTKCGLVIVKSNGPRLFELLQEKGGQWTRQLYVSGDQTMRILGREPVQDEGLAGLNSDQSGGVDFLG